LKQTKKLKTAETDEVRKHLNLEPAVTFHRAFLVYTWHHYQTARSFSAVQQLDKQHQLRLVKYFG